jgi:N-acetylmuramoyl-L-alanine amidase
MRQAGVLSGLSDASFQSRPLWRNALVGVFSYAALVAGADHAEARKKKPAAEDNPVRVTQTYTAGKAQGVLSLLSMKDWDRGDIKSLQRFLGDAGDIDGLWGSNTATALLGYIKKQGIDSSQINPEIQARLKPYGYEADAMLKPVPAVKRAQNIYTDIRVAADDLGKIENDLAEFITTIPDGPGGDGAAAKFSLDQLASVKGRFEDLGAVSSSIETLAGKDDDMLTAEQQSVLDRYQLYAEKAQGSQNPNSGLPDAMMEYLKDRPALVMKLKPAVIRDLVSYGQGRELRRLVANLPEFRDHLLKELDAFQTYSKPSSAQILKLQAALKLGGFYLDELDGVAGKGFADAIHKLKLAEGLENQVLDVQYQGLGVKLPNAAACPLMESDAPLGVSKAVYHTVWSKIMAGEPYARDVRLSANRRPLIVIDPGHGFRDKDGGIDTGARGNELQEIGLDPVSEEMGRQFQAKGYTVVYTRFPGCQLPVYGGHGGTLTARRLFTQHMQRELGARGTIFISPHGDSRDSTSSGTRVMVHGVNEVPTNPNTKVLGDRIAASGFQVGKGGTVVRIQNERIGVPGSIDAMSVDDISAAFILELGNLTNKSDAESLKKMIAAPAREVEKLVNTVDGFVMERMPRSEPDSSLKFSVPFELKG